VGNPLQHTSLAKELASLAREHPLASLLVTGGMLMSVVGQIVTVSSLYPILELLSGGTIQADTLLMKVFVSVLRFFELEPSVSNFLLCFLCAAALYGVCSGLSEAYQARFMRTIETGVRRRLIATTFQARWEYLRSLNHGEFINLVTREVELYKGVVQIAFNVLNFGMQGLFLSCLAAFVNWQMAVVGMATMALGSGVLYPVFMRANRLGHQWNEVFVELTNDVVRALRSCRVTKAQSLEPYLIKSLDAPVGKTGDVQFKLRVTDAIQGKLSEFLAVGSTVVMIFMGLAFLKSRPADILMTLIVFSRILPQIRALVDNYHRGCSHLASSSAVRGHLKQAVEAQQAEGGQAIPTQWSAIAFHDVGFGYDAGPPFVIDRLSLTIRRGEFWGIVGATGSGKTTFLDLLLGLYQPQTGTIKIDSVPLSEVNLPAWHARIGYLSQDPLVFAGTIRSNLMWGIESQLSDQTLYQALEQAHLSKLAEEDPRGLEKEIIEGGNNLSGGEKQRLALARCFLRNPQVLILDEPTSALDAASEQKIMEVLEGLRGKVTLFVVTHRLGILKSCSRVLRFAPSGVSLDQTAEGSGTPQEVMQEAR
jgi:ATP-binding cassette subfamily C protein